jgi:hypothetical protein
MFMEDEEKDKEGEGEVSEDAIGELMDEDDTEEEKALTEGEDDEYRERDWS